MEIFSLGFFASFFLAFFAFPIFIRFLNKRSLNQPIYDFCPGSHQDKAKTPTMGGVIILSVILLLSLCFFFGMDAKSYTIVFTALSFGLIGFLDDYIKIANKKNQALKAKTKFVLQVVFAALVVFFIKIFCKLEGLTTVNITQNFFIDFGWFYYIFAGFLIVATSNAANLTDGIDGLAALVFLSAFFPLFLICQEKSLSSICLTLTFFLGSCIAFLWFNAKPAQVFMGDVGSLGLGAALGTICILCKKELLLPFFAFVFLIETVSVIMQVIYFKISGGKRIFKMSPLHHHFELLGVDEGKITLRFFIVSIIVSAIGFALYKTQVVL